MASVLTGCGAAGAPIASTPPVIDELPTVASSEGTTPDPAEPELTQEIALVAPLRLVVGQRADVYLSFGPGASEVLPDSAGAQEQGGQLTTPREGAVAPVLGYNGPLTVAPVDVRPVSVTTRVAKRWHWTITVPPEASAPQFITLEPTMEYYAPGASTPEIIWPNTPLRVQVEVVPLSFGDQVQRFLSTSGSLLTLLGLSYAAVAGWLWAFLRRTLPRLRGRAPGSAAPS